MKIIIVTYKAFKQTHTAIFYKNETFEEINTVLFGICNTYEPSSIIESEDFEFRSLNALNKFKP